LLTALQPCFYGSRCEGPVKDSPNILHPNRAAAVTKQSNIQLKVTLEGKPCDGVVQIRAAPNQ
jgi:hypothetical protein